MKKTKILILFSILISIFLFGNLVSAACNLKISMLNQDPYPAIPGDYVKVVFQIDGLESPDCGEISFGIKEEYPISLDPNVTNPITIKSGTFQANYGSFYLAPYKLRLDENALNGENPIEVYHTRSLSDLTVITEFNLTVKDTRADFEIHVKDYNYATRKLTFEILNIAESDVEALTIEVPKQDEIEIKGPNRMVVGDLDSNEYTTAEFEAILPKKETKINLNIFYTDSINARREAQKVIDFDYSYFVDRNSDKKAQPYWIYILILVVVAWFVWRKIKKNKKEKERMKKRGMIQ